MWKMENTSVTYEFTLDQLTVKAFFTLSIRADDRLVIFLWSLPIMYALGANHLVLTAILRCPAMWKIPSYFFIILMCVCDLTMLYISIFLPLAYTAFRQAYIEDPLSAANFAPWYVYNSCWWTFVISLVIMAVNRLVCAVSPHQYQNIFSTRISLALAVGAAVGGFLIGLPNLHSCCYLLWFPESYSSSYWPPDSWYARFDQSFSATTTAIVVVCYTVVLIALRKTTKMVGVVSGVYVLTFSTWFLLPYTGSTSKWLYSFMTSLWFVQNATHPTIALIFNSKVRFWSVDTLRKVALEFEIWVRSEAARLVFGRRVIATPVTTTISNRTSRASRGSRG
ncbi:hypothetical protein PRIPAC_94603 [Pristionchus pacificus]|uniref:G protein-coupled receptor n=1 Tax=Pristionchus pacificus TaxID=54126 RepID=A0A2A6BPK5_PRIPA|nr:hypothetical protein PRIPAC_94603 [Pristionchus pacificus]|eukprot:PDM67837.1 G protein-coupled receptor [Pristionchus pacificus]